MQHPMIFALNVSRKFPTTTIAMTSQAEFTTAVRCVLYDRARQRQTFSGHAGFVASSLLLQLSTQEWSFTYK